MKLDFENDIIKCLETLHKGGLILYPTDTIWGIGCDATNEQAVEKIFTLKKRPAKKSMIVLAADQKEILRYVAGPDLAVFDFLDQIKEPTTVIYEDAIGFPNNLVSNDGTIAIRICNDDFCLHLIKRFRKPIVSTSPNISGKPTPKSFSEISDEIKNRVDYIVQYRQDENLPGKPSSLIRWKNGKPEKLRE